jgi:hypothetical protein
MKTRMVAEVLGAVADLIAEAPQAAVFTARKLAHIFHGMAGREEEEQRERDESRRRRGLDVEPHF